MRLEISSIIYDIIHRSHDKWRDKHQYIFNNDIIEMLRNQLSDDVKEWYEIYIARRKVKIPEKYRCERNMLSDISHRKFKGLLEPKPCEICGFNRATNIAHVIPKTVGGSDDDWNLIHLCANHHFLFDIGYF